jgi:hypothetical protein
MNDAYGSAGAEMTDTWTLFGDPSVMVFTNTPAPMITSHIANTPVGTTSIAVNNNTNGALICLSANGTILGTGVSNGISATITIPEATAGVIDVVATSFNKMPYSGTINVNMATGIIENNTSSLFSAFPVPATNTLNINSVLPSVEKVKISLVNNLGQEILVLADEYSASGASSRSFDITSVSAGSYFCKIETESTVQILQVIIQK